MRYNVRSQRTLGRRPWYRQLKPEYILILLVGYGCCMILLHNIPSLESNQIPRQPTRRAAAGQIQRAAVPEDLSREASGHRASSASQRRHRPSRGATAPRADSGGSSDAPDAEDDSLEKMLQPLAEHLPEPLRVRSTRLLPDEQPEDPPKRPFFWWFRYRQATGGFLLGRDKPSGPEDMRPLSSAYEGKDCSAPRRRDNALPSLGFNGSFILSRDKLRKERGLRFRTDPMDEPPPTKPYIRVPVSREVWEAQPDDDRIAPLFFKTCAVVGSSGILRLFDHGKQIDKSDLIIRFNRAPTKGFERHVGSRTSLRIASPMNVGWREGNESTLLPMPTKSYLYLQVVLHRRHPGSKLFLIDSEFNDYASTFLPSLPSTGFLGVLLALQRCAEVNLYGFHTSTSFGIPYHYYNNEVPRRKLAYAHDLREEASKMRALARRGLVRLADPCAAGCENVSGIKCTNCPAGSTCTCEDRYPLPVALPGFCRLRGVYSCFFACPGGPKQCPGGLRATRCSKNMTGSTLRCATADDVALMAARIAAVSLSSPPPAAATPAGAEGWRPKRPSVVSLARKRAEEGDALIKRRQQLIKTGRASS
eukprot:CAMPEP_0177626564 /NCGR_PEP_ID=MMETSP0419_2-20121207/30721_1 /TAXON_ID=582737 /ORGANISM="Tetraselmis sp., Strain GSL018" /LENGTH=589 /DNA_ID=CAMNT_0019127627 /DNA_START=106 /DNA_END=1873 /DNA_ORIENTATION=-